MASAKARRHTLVALILVVVVLLAALVWPWRVRYLFTFQAVLGAVAVLLVWPRRHGPARPVSTLVGRVDALETILNRLATMRAQRVAGPATGAAAILIHGMPGVGKSALAHELARRLTADYPSGTVTVNLNDAGEPLATGNILTTVLRALHWPDAIPSTTAERASIFRALTAGRRILFVLDAASDPAQVIGVLPSTPHCAVIITSRRNLGPQLGIWSYRLGPLEPDEALDMLTAVTTMDRFSALAASTRLVQACGRLPVAIRSVAERVVYDGHTLEELMAALLRVKSADIDWSRWDDAVTAGIAAEFERLSLLERRAICLLTLVRSPSFASWVLCPLLQVPISTSDVLATMLTTAQLLQPAERDRRFEMARYRFHPVVRAFMESQLNRDADLLAGCHDALDRLRRAYRELALAALSGHGQRPLPAFDATHGWAPAVSPRAPADSATEWVLAEQANLREVALEAVDEEPDLCWRLTAMFTEPFPHLDTAFEAAIKATGSGFLVTSELDVRVAQARVQAIAGRFDDADATVDLLAARVAQLSAHGHGPEVRRRAVLAHLTSAEVYAQLPWPERAARHLSCGRRLMLPAENADLAARADRVAALSDPGGARPDPADEYWSGLAQAAARTRAADPHGAAAVLARLCARYAGDAHREALLHHHLARAHFETHLAAAATGRTEALVAAGRHAMLSVLAAEQLEDHWGAARAHLLLARVLVAAGNAADARTHAATGGECLDAAAGIMPPYLVRERAWAEAEGLLPAAG
ncbi:NB-ARC domain-containing protein [Actinoplanes sp. NPDC049118]|uniref:NB-ARC domain-containing protein n=1 Tax=Actinoplanes sp. NPDC049118 TaxID=3155769 RepID=UPI0033F506A8